MTGAPASHSGDDRDVVGSLLGVGGPRVSPPDEVDGRVRAAVHAAWQRSVRARRARWWALAVSLPAGAAIILAIAVNVRPLSDARPPSPASPVASPVVVATVETAAGSGFRVFDAVAGRWTEAVPGGAVKAGNLLEVASDAGGALRTADGVSLRIAGRTRARLLAASDLSLERGAVYVDNPGGESRGSITVRTPFGLVREIGTQFEARLHEAFLRVRVREGAVLLERNQQTDTAPAGIELRIGADGTLARRQIPMSGGEWAWAVAVAPAMVIEGARLDTFLGWATREMGWRLRFASDALERESSGTILHGSIDGLTPDQAVETVLATCGLTHRVQDGTLVIGDADRKTR
ncbi:MAG: FecR family protein [Acidobacteriota bacterium]